MTIHDRIARLSARHHGVLSFDELREIGVPSSTIDDQVRTGRWVRRAPGLYEINGVPRTWEHELLLAVRAAGPSAVASHRSAAALHLLAESRRTIAEVTTVHGGRLVGRLGKVHETRHLDDVDVTHLDGIPVTEVARTIIDLAAVVPARRVGIALDDARRRRLVTLEEVDQRLTDLGTRGRPGAGTIRRLIGERADRDPTGSPLAQLLYDAILDAGLPRPEVEYEVVDGEFRAFFDLAYPPIQLGIEADGEQWHLDLEHFTGDRIRQNRLELLGWHVLRYPSGVIRRDVGRAVDEIGRFIHRSERGGSAHPGIPA